MNLTSDAAFSPALSDEALAFAVQQGDRAALEQLIGRYRPFAEKCASRFRGVSLEADDFVQEANLALLSAAYTYAPHKNAGFKTYASVCVKNRLRSVLRAEAAEKNTPLNSYVPLDELQLPTGMDLEEELISAQETDALIAQIERVLSPLEKQVLLYKLEGLRYKEISARLHITEKSINNALQRVRVKLKEFNRS